MKVRITHLKAPWPEGALVGDVLEVRVLPAWAIGKCEPAEDDAEVTVELPEPVAPEAPQDKAAEMVEHFRAQAQAAIDRAEEAHALAQAELQVLLAKAQEANSELQTLLDASEAKVAELEAKALPLAEAEKQAAEEIAANEAKPVGPENVTITGTEKPSTGKKK